MARLNINTTDYSSNSINQDDNFKDAAGEIFNRISGTSIEALEACINDINKMIESRLELNKKLMKDLETTEVKISNFIANHDVHDSQSREQLILFKSKEVEVAEAKRSEDISCWQDISKLKEELRRYTRELSEKRSRHDMLDNILTK